MVIVADAVKKSVGELGSRRRREEDIGQSEARDAECPAADRRPREISTYGVYVKDQCFVGLFGWGVPEL